MIGFEIAFYDLKTGKASWLLSWACERSVRNLDGPDPARTLPGLLSRPAHRVRSRFGIFSLPAGFDRLALQEISTVACSFMPRLRAENRVRGV